jgi:hypothetical protein
MRSNAPSRAKLVFRRRVLAACGLSALLGLAPGCSRVHDFELLSSRELNGGAGTRLVIPAQQRGSLAVASPDASDDGSYFGLEFLPPGAEFSPATGLLDWQTDLQDIGKSFSGFVTHTRGNSTERTAWKIEVVPPKAVARECSYLPEPVIGSVQPRQVWHYNGWTDPAGNRYYLTFSSPVAADLDGDGKVEIVTILSREQGYYASKNGPLVVLKADPRDAANQIVPGGQVIWNSMADAGLGFEVSTTPSLIDLDRDGVAEIVTTSMRQDGGRQIDVIAYHRNPAQIAVRASYNAGFRCGGYCMTAVADLDGDSSAEIVAGNVVLNKLGALKFFLNPEPSSYIFNTVTLADLDSDTPGLEIVASGAQVYSGIDGRRLWKGSCLGSTAVADLDGDGKAELVCLRLEGHPPLELGDSLSERGWIEQRGRAQHRTFQEG